MKQKNIAFLAAVLLLPTLSFAQNGVRYNYTHTDGVLYDCSVYTDSIIINGATPGTVTQVSIPDSIAYGGAKRPVREIGAQAFSYSDIVSVLIPNTITEIGYGAFEGCSMLETATIGTGVHTIWETAFASCSALNTLNFNAVSASFFAFSGSGVLDDCDELATINVGPDVTVLPEDLVGSVFPLVGLTTINIAAERMLPLTSGYFGHSVSGLSITVPCSQLSVYQSNTVWSALGTISANCGEIPDINICDSTVYDTIHVTLYDTTYVSLYDTTHVTLYDTVHITVYDTVQVGIELTGSNPVKVYTTNGQLVIEGATFGEPVALYDMSGRMIISAIIQKEKELFPLPAAGAYLLRTGQNRTQKVVVRR